MEERAQGVRAKDWEVVAAKVARRRAVVGVEEARALVKVQEVKAEKEACQRAVGGAGEARNPGFPFRVEAPCLERAVQLHMVMVEASQSSFPLANCLQDAVPVVQCAARFSEQSTSYVA